jgi:prepilin peptidase CpaA
VPNALNGGLALVGLAFAGLSGGGWGLWQAILGLATGFALVILPFALRLYRGGDAKLVMAMGVWLGPALTLWAFLFGMVAGGILGVALAVLGGRDARQEIRRTVEAAVVTATLPQVDPHRPARHHVPMALAFGAGAFVALWRMI